MAEPKISYDQLYDFYKGKCEVIKKQDEEIATLRRFLEIALDANDDEHGVTNAEMQPKRWDVQARKYLDR
jgi:hypothetical protein